MKLEPKLIRYRVPGADPRLFKTLMAKLEMDMSQDGLWPIILANVSTQVNRLIKYHRDKEIKDILQSRRLAMVNSPIRTLLARRLCQDLDQGLELDRKRNLDHTLPTQETPDIIDHLTFFFFFRCCCLFFLNEFNLFSRYFLGLCFLIPSECLNYFLKWNVDHAVIYVWHNPTRSFLFIQTTQLSHLNPVILFYMHLKHI